MQHILANEPLDFIAFIGRKKELMITLYTSLWYNLSKESKNLGSSIDETDTSAKYVFNSYGSKSCRASSAPGSEPIKMTRLLTHILFVVESVDNASL